MKSLAYVVLIIAVLISENSNAQTTQPTQNAKQSHSAELSKIQSYYRQAKKTEVEGEISWDLGPEMEAVNNYVKGRIRIMAIKDQGVAIQWRYSQVFYELTKVDVFITKQKRFVLLPISVGAEGKIGYSTKRFYLDRYNDPVLASLFFGTFAEDILQSAKWTVQTQLNEKNGSLSLSASLKDSKIKRNYEFATKDGQLKSLSIVKPYNTSSLTLTIKVDSFRSGNQAQTTKDDILTVPPANVVDLDAQEAANLLKNVLGTLRAIKAAIPLTQSRLGKSKVSLEDCKRAGLFQYNQSQVGDFKFKIQYHKQNEKAFDIIAISQNAAMTVKLTHEGALFSRKTNSKEWQRRSD